MSDGRRKMLLCSELCEFDGIDFLRNLTSSIVALLLFCLLFFEVLALNRNQILVRLLSVIVFAMFGTERIVFLFWIKKFYFFGHHTTERCVLVQ